VIHARDGTFTSLNDASCVIPEFVVAGVDSDGQGLSLDILKAVLDAGVVVVGAHSDRGISIGLRFLIVFASIISCSVWVSRAEKGSFCLLHFPHMDFEASSAATCVSGAVDALLLG